MLPTDPLPYVVDEFTAYDSVGEMTDPCKLSSLSRIFGSMAHNARVGRIRTSIKNLLNIVKAKGECSIADGRIAAIQLIKAEYAQHSLPFRLGDSRGHCQIWRINLFEYAGLKFPSANEHLATCVLAACTEEAHERFLARASRDGKDY